MTDVDNIEERFARMAERARQHPNFGRSLPCPTPKPIVKAQVNAPPEHKRVHRGCPIEREFNDDQARQFAHASESTKETLLDSANQVAGMERLLRDCGGWLENTAIADALGITHVNNVASKLRDALDARRTGEDVDAKAITATRWAYRICLKSDSFRLHRDNPSRKSSTHQ